MVRDRLGERMARIDSQPFADVRVVEFGQFVSVPFCAQLLAEGGAEVLKVEPLAGDGTRLMKPLAPLETRTFISRNRGKRSLPLALRSPAAKPVVDALLGWADVALMNFRPSLGPQIGLDEETLRRRFPRLISGNVTAFGKRGPEAALAGMDTVVQARTGLMAANGRVIDGRPAPGDPVSADYMAAMSLAFGIAAALLRRERTGKGGSVDVSLMQAAMTLANSQLTRSEAEDAEAHAEALARLGDQRRRGASYSEQAAAMTSARPLPLSMVYLRTYDTADAPIAIACGSRSLRVKFLGVLGLEDAALDANYPPKGHYDALMREAEACMRQRTAAEWTALLNAAGVPVAQVRFPSRCSTTSRCAPTACCIACRTPPPATSPCWRRRWPSTATASAPAPPCSRSPARPAPYWPSWVFPRMKSTACWPRRSRGSNRRHPHKTSKGG